jgi:hypothetical protein
MLLNIRTDYGCVWGDAISAKQRRSIFVQLLVSDEDGMMLSALIAFSKRNLQQMCYLGASILRFEKGVYRMYSQIIIFE